MKYLLFILFVLIIGGCNFSTKQRDKKIADLLRMEVDSLSAADTSKMVVCDSLVLLKINTITEKQRIDIAIAETTESTARLQDFCRFIKKKLNSTRAACELHMNDTTELGKYYVHCYQSDTEDLRKDSIKIAHANKRSDSLRSAVKSSAFWGYCINTRIYFHGTNNSKLKMDRIAFVTKYFTIDQF